jgi:energy-coupling factor transporter ATP-binding protein EcfA2
MLDRLSLTNFRGFEKHTISLRPLSVLVGRNNAGKSSIIEALRIVSIVTARYLGFTYHTPPDWIDLPLADYGASPDLRNLQIEFDTLCYEYRDPPAVIEARFTNRTGMRVYLSGENRVHAVVLDVRGRPVRSKGAARALELPRVAIMPQAGPLAREEKLLSSDYVLGVMDSTLSSLHFRNQLRIRRDLLQSFASLAEATWPGFKIESLDPRKPLPGDPIYVQVRNDEFVGEVGKMGHGLQMWLQTLWFLARSEKSQTLILDEPDVYLHADLQRRLIRHLKTRGTQVVVATHSVEIMAEVEPENIVVVERRRRSSPFADSIPAVQSLLQRVGSAQNIHATRIWNARRFLIVEGDDLKILRHLYDALHPEAETSLEAIPNMAIGGWNGWSLAMGSALTLKNALGEKISTYCLLDRDYHCDEEIAERYQEAEERGIELHIWDRKELENYLLVPAAVVRVVRSRAEDSDVSEEEIDHEVAQLATKLRNRTVDALATSIFDRDRRNGLTGANTRARAILAEREQRDGDLRRVASGKELLSQLSAWVQTRAGVGISAISLARALHPREIPDEARKVLAAIASGAPFA